MNHCTCKRPHESKQIVVTGGPGAGKTAVLETIRRAMCRHVCVLPEAAGIVFGGGFPRGTTPEARQPAQRAIYYVQRELEATVAPGDAAIVLCDRGTIDGLAYWPGPGELWSAVGTTFERELARYDAVVHLRTPSGDSGYNNVNPLRIETAVEAKEIDDRIAIAWAWHPHRYEIAAEADFIAKARHAIAVIRSMLPVCCNAEHHVGASTVGQLVG